MLLLFVFFKGVSLIIFKMSKGFANEKSEEYGDLE